MNFLAHCLIADRAANGDEEIIAGGVIGEFVKGPVPATWPEGLAAGVRLHRRVDAYSNQLASLKVSANRFASSVRRFAPIYVDVIADHCLARQWDTYAQEPVQAFAQRCYRAIDEHSALIEGPHTDFLTWMVREDLLSSYDRWTSVERALRSISRRLKREELTAPVIDTTLLHLADFEEDFSVYFPDLVAHATSWVDDNHTRAP
jgi:acyl carrier protein phosphodiesterase